MCKPANVKLKKRHGTGIKDILHLHSVKFRKIKEIGEMCLWHLHHASRGVNVFLLIWISGF